MSIIFLVYFAGLVIIGYLISTFILHSLNYVCKVKGNTFGKSLLVVLAILIAESVFAVLGIIFPGIAGPLSIIGLFAQWIVGYELYNKFYKSTWKEFRRVFGLYYLVGILLLGAALFVRLHFFEPVLLIGDSMVPTYQPGDYIIFEKWDKTLSKGDIVLVSLPCSSGQSICAGIMRVSAVPGDSVNGGQVQSNEYYLTSDNRPGKSSKITIGAVIGKPILSVGRMTSN